MKKVDFKKQILLSRRRQRKAFARRKIRSLRRSLRLKRDFDDRQIAPVKTVAPGIRRHTIDGPANVCLQQNYEETLNFLKQVRSLSQRHKGKLHVNLKTVTRISPSGAILLVAEIDRWRISTQREKMRAIDLENWNPTVRRTLKEMGFFSLLGADCAIEDLNDSASDKFLSFMSGSQSEGEKAKMFRANIEELGPKVADKESLFDCLTEAMTNVRQHAYDSTDVVRHWWLSASVNTTKKRLTVMFLDHGQSIPATLPRSKWWEQFRGLLSFLPLKDDAKLIEAAISTEKSRTGEDHRGNGLVQNIKGYVQSHQTEGRLTIVSRHGKCTYTKLLNGDESISTTELKTPFRGTFLEWVIEDYSVA
jgi:anti-anti-sigma regulatory factor